MNTTLSFTSSSGGDVRIPVPRTQLNGASLQKQRPCDPVRNLLLL